MRLAKTIVVTSAALWMVACGSLDSMVQSDKPLPSGEPIDGTPYNNERRQSMQKPAILALLAKANKSEQAGNLDGAAANLERALRINSSDARLWHKLARLRLRQHRLQQAADLAFKSNGYASRDKSLQAENWRVIYNARQRLGDMSGALDALAKARSLED